MMFFKAGPCFPSKRIRQFSDGETVHDAIPLSTGISLSGVINELAPKELLENEWNCVLADRSLLLVRQALVGQKDFATVHLISLLDWLLKLQELSPTNHWSSARPMILYLCPDEHRLEKVKYIFARLTVEWEEYGRRSVPVLISTPSKLVTLLSSNQVNVEIIEKIFIENVSAFKVSIFNILRIFQLHLRALHISIYPGSYFDWLKMSLEEIDSPSSQRDI